MEDSSKSQYSYLFIWLGSIGFYSFPIQFGEETVFCPKMVPHVRKVEDLAKAWTNSFRGD